MKFRVLLSKNVCLSFNGSCFTTPGSSPPYIFEHFFEFAHTLSNIIFVCEQNITRTAFKNHSRNFP